ncbi:hypothetical protein VPH35_105178 [Triticum aestivum]
MTELQNSGRFRSPDATKTESARNIAVRNPLSPRTILTRSSIRSSASRCPGSLSCTPLPRAHHLFDPTPRPSTRAPHSSRSLAANGNDRRGHGAPLHLHLRLLGPPPPPPPLPGLRRPAPLPPRPAAPPPRRPPAGLPHQRRLLLVRRGRGGGRARAQGRQARARHGAPPRLPRRQGARPGHPGHGGRHQAVRRRLEGQAHHRQLPLQGRVPAHRRHPAQTGQALRPPTRGRVRVHRRRMRPLYLPLCNNCTWPSKPTAFLIYNNNGRSVGVCILFRCVCVCVCVCVW